jgi:hypothetical protein
MIGLSFCLSDLINITNNPLQLGECLSERGDYSGMILWNGIYRQAYSIGFTVCKWDDRVFQI